MVGGGGQGPSPAPPSGGSTSLGFLGFFFLLIAVLSFTRGVQRLFEQTWELEPLSVRNTFNGLLWIVGLLGYLAATGLLCTASWAQPFRALGRPAVRAAGGRVPRLEQLAVLSAKRIPRRTLLPFGLLGAVLLTLYSVGAAVYVPHLFSTYSTRYGVIGAVFAMISALFCVMVVMVGSAAAGRRCVDELGRYGGARGLPTTRSSGSGRRSRPRRAPRWDTLRERIDEYRRKRRSG